jgi:hypothetical protein
LSQIPSLSTFNLLTFRSADQLSPRAPLLLATMSDSSRLTQTRTLVAATAALATLVTAGSILGGQAIRRRLRTAELKRQVEADLAGQPWNDTSALDKTAELEGEGGDGVRLESGTPPSEKVWARGEYDEELIREQVRACSCAVVVSVADPAMNISWPETIRSSAKRLCRKSGIHMSLWYVAQVTLTS